MGVSEAVDQRSSLTMAKRKRTKRNIMLNKTPTREEKIE
jgi:hypothetical protein